MTQINPELQHLIPTKGVLVRDPVTGFTLPTEGGLVPKNDYWQRRITQGDAVLSPAETNSTRNAAGRLPQQSPQAAAKSPADAQQSAPSQTPPDLETETPSPPPPTQSSTPSSIPSEQRSAKKSN